jgi:anti-sigma factor RsiW
VSGQDPEDGVTNEKAASPARFEGSLEEQVTAYVDGVLDEGARARIEAVLAERPDLREQAEFERDLRARLLALPVPEPRPGFEAQAHAAVRAARPRPRAYVLLPLAATLFLALWARGLPGFVALEVARDHRKCFSRGELPAKVWSDDPHVIASWFEDQGTPMPQLPAGVSLPQVHAGVAHIQLVGARYCPLGDRSVPHVYYAGGRHQVSLFVVTGPLRFDGDLHRESLGQSVRFLRTAGLSLALVAEEPELVDAFAEEFQLTLARLEPPALR